MPKFLITRFREGLRSFNSFIIWGPNQKVFDFARRPAGEGEKNKIPGLCRPGILRIFPRPGRVLYSSLNIPPLFIARYLPATIGHLFDFNVEL